MNSFNGDRERERETERERRHTRHRADHREIDLSTLRLRLTVVIQHYEMNKRKEPGFFQNVTHVTKNSHILSTQSHSIYKPKLVKITDN